MSPADDALELLLPDASEAARERARSVVRCLRLVVDDAHASRAQTVGVDLTRARRELDRHGRAQIDQALRELLRQHLEAAVPADSCAWFGEPGAGWSAAWSALEEQRASEPELPSVPAPGETALEVAERLLACFEAARGTGGEAGLWRARWTQLAHGPRAAEPLFRAAHAAALAGQDVALARSALAGTCECLLERGAVREARQLLLESLPRCGVSARLRVLLAWTRVVLDDAAGARSALVGVKPWTGPLPRSLAELRERRREWVPVLAGRARPLPRAPRPSETAPWRDRATVGASVLAVFVFERGAGARNVWIDAAPALRSAVAEWLADGEEAAAVPGTWAHRVVVAARGVVEHRADGLALASVLGGVETRAVFVEPVLDDDGEVAGWLHAEFEHHLVPSAVRRAELAATWREAVLRGTPLARHPSGALRTSSGARSPGALEPDAEPGAAACAILRPACEELVDALGLKTAQRLWWVFEARGLDASELSACAHGGQGQGFKRADVPASQDDAARLADRHAGGGRRKALERALSAGGPISFDAPDERLSIHAHAGSGVVLVLRVFGRVVGLLAIESSRRRDFTAGDLERLQAVCDARALRFRVAQFRSWHALRFGHDVVFDAERGDFRAFAERLVLAARSSSAVVISGARGCGKQVLARWLHFEGPAPEHPLRVVGCRGIEGARAARALVDPGPGTVVVEELELAAPAVQEELARQLESEDRLLRGDERHADVRKARLVVALPARLEQLAAEGRLRADLAQSLDRVQLSVPSLRDRREDILPLVECLAQRFAVEEGARVPSFGEASLALLWRQSWDGNVRELENLVYKLVVFSAQLGPGRPRALEPDDVLTIARQNGLELLRRLPSRHPRRSDLIAALRVSRTRRGRINKTRAALFLGWDPDTLVSRMSESGIAEIGPGDELVWRDAPPPAGAAVDAGPETAEAGASGGSSTERAGAGSVQPEVPSGGVAAECGGATR